jgi:hypothetical protein
LECGQAEVRQFARGHQVYPAQVPGRMERFRVELKDSWQISEKASWPRMNADEHGFEE